MKYSNNGVYVQMEKQNCRPPYVKKKNEDGKENRKEKKICGRMPLWVKLVLPFPVFRPFARWSMSVYVFEFLMKPNQTGNR